jgi:hypothetical protein
MIRHKLYAMTYVLQLIFVGWFCGVFLFSVFLQTVPDVSAVIRTVYFMQIDHDTSDLYAAETLAKGT